MRRRTGHRTARLAPTAPRPRQGTAWGEATCRIDAVQASSRGGHLSKMGGHISITCLIRAGTKLFGGSRQAHGKIKLSMDDGVRSGCVWGARC